MASDLFKVGFDIHDYQDILPSVHEYRANGDEVMNLQEQDLDKCVWRIEEPKVITKEYIEQEVRRIIQTGYWVVIKGMPLWLPPNYYFFLKYFNLGGRKPEFRLNRLIAVYKQVRVRKNPRALGTITVKARQIGETSFEMSNVLWEAISMDYGMLGIQSMSLRTVKISCWRTLLSGWYGIPQWLKSYLYPDFKSKDQMASTMRFWREADPELTDKDGNPDMGKDVLITYGAGSHNAFDSATLMRGAKLDEWLKWVEASPYATFLNYEKFMAVGATRNGLFSIFSSPADFETRYLEETYDFWVGSDPEKLTSEGTTSTRIFRIMTSPLTGIQGYYDKWGDADANEIYDVIMAKRKTVPKEYRMGEIRANPLNDEEIFGSFEGGHVWSNSKGIINRKMYIINTRYKDEISKEPTRLYGNLEWSNGEIDSEVDFRMADRDNFDVIEARWSIPNIPVNKERLLKNQNGIWLPPKIPQSCLGIDPIDKRYVASNSKGFSNAAMVNWVFADIFQDGKSKYPSLIYSCRPSHAEIFFEDAIKAAIFTRSMVQVESINSKIIDYFEDRGYMDWLLSKRGQSRDSKQKGDAPSGKGMYLTEIMLLIDSVTNTPLNDGDRYLLDEFWLWELLEDLSKFNPKDTHANDLSMAFGASLLGTVKMLASKTKRPSKLNNAILDFMIG
jgi:hypothetical protein